MSTEEPMTHAAAIAINVYNLYFLGCPLAQIAEALKIPIGAVAGIVEQVIRCKPWSPWYMI